MHARTLLYVVAMAGALLSCAAQDQLPRVDGDRAAEIASNKAPRPGDAARGATEVDPTGPYLVVLGTAQDGGDPQVGDPDLERWSSRARRLPTSLALVDAATSRRFLFEATPAFAQQLVELDRLAPREQRPGLDGIFLTHAHIGHYAGLMFLGFEVIGASNVPVYVMPEMASYLRTNGPWSQLVSYENIELRLLQAEAAVELGGGLTVTAVPVPHRREFSETVAFRIAGPRRTVLFLPDIDGWEEWDALGVRVEDQIARVDVAYLDGSFWFHGEVPGRDMSGFPHPMIKQGMQRFSTLPAAERSKIRWIHLNHTNPATEPDSPERAEIEDAGMRVAEQGERVAL